MDKPVKAEISKDGKYVDVFFPYHPDFVKKVKAVTSWRFISSGRHWRVDLNMPTMRKLREQFGNDLELQPKLREWGYHAVNSERDLIELATAEDADLTGLVPDPLLEGVKRPDGRYFELRPAQRADIAFMSQGKFINANQPGFGKTAEYIGTTMAMDLAWGQHLMFAPVTSLELVWKFEIEELYAAAGLEPPTVFTGDTPAQRKRAIQEAMEYAEDGLAFWLVLNPAMGRMKTVVTAEGKAKLAKNKDLTEEDYEPVFVHPQLAEIDWDSMNIDEFHLCGLSNLSTQTAIGMNQIAQETQPTLRGCMSGTPMRGKPVKLFGALHFVEPEKHPNLWPWAKQWLEIKVSERNDRPTREIEGIQKGREAEFYEYLSQWLIRREKTGLPPKNRIPVWCKMTPSQAAQYRQFELEAELRIDDAEEEGRLTAPNILAEYMRLKQFASARCDVKRRAIEKQGMPVIEVKPTLDSGKYAQLVEKLEEENVIVPKSDLDEAECAIIFSQFNPVVESVTELMEKHHVPVLTITGKVNRSSDRMAIAKAFQLQSIDFLQEEEWQKRSKSKIVQKLLEIGPPRVIVMNIMAGGTTMTLTKANSVHILDETWVPDEQEQAEDRSHRDDDLTKLKDEVRIYYYRMRDTIEEYIMEVVEDKEFNNRNVLRLREFLRERLAEEQGGATREKASAGA